MKLAIDYYPLLKFYHAGPKVFLNRLKDSIIKQNLCDVKSPFLPLFDVAIYSVYEKNYFNKKYLLRVDGIYFDNQNTVGNTMELNQKIFDSINKSIGIIYISNFSKMMVHKFLGKLSLPETVIHNKVPLDIFNPQGKNFREKLGLNKEDRILITSAHWRRHKRLKETIKLIRYLNEQGSKKYKLIILGKNNKKFILDKNIYYAGEIKPNNLASWYRTADIYIHLAWIEPCGNTQIEAMACGLPVICCNNGGIGETVIDAKGGIVVKTDPNYKMNLINYYDPPEPNYKELHISIKKIFEQYDQFKNNINYKILDIDYGAELYTSFIKNALYSKKN
tara:strand:+ start:2341 stop:3342 length:1002 start_codon:yes stop_codon:yes gene_type:complete